MKYLCLIYFDEKELYARPQKDLDRLMDEHDVFNHDITQSGQLLGTDPLEPVNATTTVRVRNGKSLVVDGPFAETKEQLGGFYLVEARDAEEAAGIAAKIPGARHGSIEVRPIMTFSS